MNKNEGVAFDPGFSQYVYAFEETLGYLYNDINRYKNFSQKKMKFMQYYKKILEMFYNNIGFYTGCLMWAAHIKSLPEQTILNNPYLGKEYIENIEIESVNFLRSFINSFPKDMKYYLAKDFLFDESYEKLINAYEQFLIINKGFTISEKISDIKLPDGLKIDSGDYKEKIENAISKKDLSLLKDNINIVIQ